MLVGQNASRFTDLTLLDRCTGDTGEVAELSAGVADVLALRRSLHPSTRSRPSVLMLLTCPALVFSHDGRKAETRCMLSVVVVAAVSLVLSLHPPWEWWEEERRGREGFGWRG